MRSRTLLRREDRIDIVKPAEISQISTQCYITIVLFFPINRQPFPHDEMRVVVGNLGIWKR